MEEFYAQNELAGQGKRGRGKNNINDDTQFKSKNLEAERRRRHKLNDRLINLRALVPNITNMNKATIIDDAITYITGLQKHVKGLGDQLIEIETQEAEKQGSVEDCRVQEEQIEKLQVEDEVKVTCLDDHRLWFKIICDSKRGGFTKLMEIMNGLGFEITDINVTTSKGVTLIMFCVEVTNAGMVAVDKLQHYLLQLMGSSSENRQCS
ncbi:Transcription factor like [Thalictrum thalictroides]|uniref:Transcription factor like n=1 Tax=Thalictrum thalictroides TaxID=46969 RepID=A0A7J6VXW1_THATH|nr:Transcription factor like [Thalictrum thalictroides]